MHGLKVNNATGKEVRYGSKYVLHILVHYNDLNTEKTQLIYIIRDKIGSFPSYDTKMLS